MLWEKILSNIMVRKRDGSLEKYNEQKVKLAVEKAVVSNTENGDTAETMVFTIMYVFTNEMKNNIDETINIEDIQNIVEDSIMKCRYFDIAKAFILYRQKHMENRSTDLMKTIDDYIGEKSWEVKENSNSHYSLQGLNNQLVKKQSQKYWLEKIYTKDIRNAHNNGEIHIHDLGSLSVYCVGHDLKQLLMEGFTGVEGKTSSKPAKHFDTALYQIVNYIYTLQGEASGAQAFSNFDTLLAPFIHYDNLSYNNVRQSMQSFVFLMNVSTRAGFETPFSNLSMDLQCPNIYKDEYAIVGGKIVDKKYGAFQKEMNMINRAFLEVMREGDSDGRVFTFPIPTYSITKDFDWDNKDLDILWEVTGKYGIPFFSNFVNSDLNPEDVRSLCCRLNIDNTRLKYRGGGLFGSNPLTGSINVITINLPRIGYKSNSGLDFILELDRLLDIAYKTHETKRKMLEKWTEEGLYPYTKHYLRGIKQATGKYWSNHFSTIGIIGMNEALLNMDMGKITSTDGKDFALEIMDHIRRRLDEFEEKSGNNYNLEATPAEGTTHRLAMKDAQELEGCTVQGGKGSEYYTNSTHAPVDFSNDVFEILEHQDKLQTKYTGGTVVHLFAGERIENTENVKRLVRSVCENYHLPYFSITPTFSICKKCGYINGEHYECPTCGKETEVYSRPVGFIRPVKNWNNGKRKEFEERELIDI